jgi:hypothetical protein
MYHFGFVPQEDVTKGLANLIDLMLRMLIDQYADGVKIAESRILKIFKFLRIYTIAI